ncbi:MAG TPA: hypothetical protein VKX17_02540 [Planctomycetota bacterium]|nr:hypothetical protein [Planctomycetota bacterium]
MNTRLLYVVLFVQFVFAGALICIGLQSRANRKESYLELTHRVTEGYASAADFEELAARLRDDADKTTVRTLFGLPVVRANQIEVVENGKTSALKGELWIYYPLTSPSQASGTVASPIDAADAAKLSGPVTCFVVEFDAHGAAKGRLATVNHPLAPVK